MDAVHLKFTVRSLAQTLGMCDTGRKHGNGLPVLEQRPVWTVEMVPAFGRSDPHDVNRDVWPGAVPVGRIELRGINEVEAAQFKLNRDYIVSVMPAESVDESMLSRPRGALAGTY